MVWLTPIGGEWNAGQRLPACSVRTALTHYLDISCPPSQTFLQVLIDSNCVHNNREREEISQLASVSIGGEPYWQFSNLFETEN